MIKGLNKKEQLLLLFLFLVLIAGGLLKFITKKDKDIKIYRVIEEESSSEKSENYQETTDIDSILNKTIKSESDKKIDINTATVQELDRLPGVGPSRAKSIIEYRTQVGGFKNIEELKNVGGIGEKTFSSLKDRIYATSVVSIQKQEEPIDEDKPFQAPIEVTQYPEFKEIQKPQPAPVVEEDDNVVEKININTADEFELRKLPGIGEKRAQAIIDYRKIHGDFEKPSDIMRVMGIGKKTYEKNKYLITTE